MKNVFVAFSGGVDSTAVLLLEKLNGNKVTAFTMDWIPDELSSAGYGKQVVEYARKSADKLGVPFVVVDLKREFREKIVNYFVDEYINGRTPNPCVLCNRDIKFGMLFDKARELGADILLTGHYLRRIKIDDRWFLTRGIEPRIEQSYFLAMVKQEVLEYVDFPLGEMTRLEVEDFLKKEEINILPKSQEICFVNDDYGSLVKGLNNEVRGKGLLIGPNNEELREHDGYYNFTIGQRKGLRVGYGEPIYVSKIDSESGNVYTSFKDDLYCDNMVVERLNWFKRPDVGASLSVQIRYRSKPVGCVVYYSGDVVNVKFNSPQVVVPGQLAAFYNDDLLIGGGWIRE